MRAERWFALCALVLLLASAMPAQKDASTPTGGYAEGGVIDNRPLAERHPPVAQQARVHVDLQTHLKDLKVEEIDGKSVVRVVDDDGTHLVPAEDWVRSLGDAQGEQRKLGILYVLFNITGPAGFLWVTVGFVAQALFMFRMLVQWWASEKHKRSVIPVSFWWGSLFGGAMLFAYFIWRRDIVSVIGQSTGVVVYARNLILIYRGKRIETEAARTLSDDEPDPKDDHKDH